MISSHKAKKYKEFFWESGNVSVITSVQSFLHIKHEAACHIQHQQLHRATSGETQNQKGWGTVKCQLHNSTLKGISLTVQLFPVLLPSRFTRWPQTLLIAHQSNPEHNLDVLVGFSATWHTWVLRAANYRFAAGKRWTQTILRCFVQANYRGTLGNHRLVWVGRHLKPHLVPNPRHGHGHLPEAQGSRVLTSSKAVSLLLKTFLQYSVKSVTS